MSWKLNLHGSEGVGNGLPSIDKRRGKALTGSKYSFPSPILSYVVSCRCNCCCIIEWSRGLGLTSALMNWEFCPPGPDAIRLPMTAFGDFAGSYARLPITDKISE